MLESWTKSYITGWKEIQLSVKQYVDETKHWPEWIVSAVLENPRHLCTEQHYSLRIVESGFRSNRCSKWTWKSVLVSGRQNLAFTDFKWRYVQVQRGEWLIWKSDHLDANILTEWNASQDQSLQQKEQSPHGAREKEAICLQGWRWSTSGPKLRDLHQRGKYTVKRGLSRWKESISGESVEEFPNEHHSE